MDQPGLDTAEHARALHGLRRINQASRSDAILWKAIARLTGENRREPIRILDLACGGGDVALAVARRAARAGWDVRLEGGDLSSVAVQCAEQGAADTGLPVRFFRLNALEDPLPEEYDVVMCSLFLHHLGEEDALRLLRKMAAAARRLVLVDDLLRSRVGYTLAWAGCRLLSRSPIVHHDGPVSVAAAWTLAEVHELANRAGLERARLTCHWPWRFLLAWSRHSP